MPKAAGTAPNARSRVPPRPSSVVTTHSLSKARPKPNTLSKSTTKSPSKSKTPSKTAAKSPPKSVVAGFLKPSSKHSFKSSSKTASKESCKTAAKTPSETVTKTSYKALAKDPHKAPSKAPSGSRKPGDVEKAAKQGSPPAKKPLTSPGKSVKTPTESYSKSSTLVAAKGGRDAKSASATGARKRKAEPKPKPAAPKDPLRKQQAPKVIAKAPLHVRPKPAASAKPAPSSEPRSLSASKMSTKSDFKSPKTSPETGTAEESGSDGSASESGSSAGGDGNTTRQTSGKRKGGEKEGAGEGAEEGVAGDEEEGGEEISTTEFEAMIAWRDFKYDIAKYVSIVLGALAIATIMHFLRQSAKARYGTGYITEKPTTTPTTESEENNTLLFKAKFIDDEREDAATDLPEVLGDI